MIDAGQQRAEHLAVADDAADARCRQSRRRDSRARGRSGGCVLPWPRDLVIGHRHLERRIDRLGSGIRKEDVIERLWASTPSADFSRGRRRAGWPIVEPRRVVQGLGQPRRSPTKSRCGRVRRSRTRCPAAVHDLVAVDGVVCISLAPASSRGVVLNARFAVNGIQCAARSFGTATGVGRGLLSSMGGLYSVWGDSYRQTISFVPERERQRAVIFPRQSTNSEIGGGDPEYFALEIRGIEPEQRQLRIGGLELRTAAADLAQQPALRRQVRLLLRPGCGGRCRARRDRRRRLASARRGIRAAGRPCLPRPHRADWK